MRSARKAAGVHDIKMLDRPGAVKRFESPASAILARNVRVKIKDIPKATSLRGRVVP